MANASFLNKKVAIVAILASGLVSAVLVGSVAIASAQEEEQERAGMLEITGTVNVKENAREFMNESVKVSFVDAATTAQAEVEGGKVLGGHIGVVQGYLVYNFIVADASGETVYKVIVDVGNGEVLYKSDGSEFGSMMFGHRGFGLGGFGHGKHFGGAWAMNPPGMGWAN
ncbi:MAG TPA: hypothetical protein VFZ05_00590 [Nitrososphaera sp.]